MTCHAGVPRLGDGGETPVAIERPRNFTIVTSRVALPRKLLQNKLITEHDVSSLMDGQFKAIRIRGKIEGFLFGIVSRLDTQFDESVWQSHYGSVMLYCSFPLYRKERAPDTNKTAYITGRFDHEIDESIMDHDIPFPETASGAIVFEDGIAAIQTDRREGYIIELSNREFLTVSHLVGCLFTTLRNADPKSKNG